MIPLLAVETIEINKILCGESVNSLLLFDWNGQLFKFDTMLIDKYSMLKLATVTNRKRNDL